MSRGIRARSGPPGRGRFRPGWGVLWRKDPFILARYPGLLAAVLGSGLVLAVAAASQSMFVSAAANATLEKNVDQLCPWGVGLSVEDAGALSGTTKFRGRPIAASALFAQRSRYLASLTRSWRALSPPIITILAFDPLTVRRASGAGRTGRATVQLLTRDGALSHVRVLQSAPGPGVWITDTTAAAIGVRAGDRIVLSGPGSATVRVAGIYRDLASGGALPNFWCSQTGDIYPLSAFSPPLPPLVLADRATFTALERRLRQSGEFSWEYALRPGSTVSEVRALVGPVSRFTDQTNLAFQPGYRAPGPFRYPGVGSYVPAVLDQAQGTIDSLRGPAGTIALAGRLVAIMVIAAAGLYVLDRRQREMSLLRAKGMGPVRVAAKLVAESLLPMAVAVLLGWLSARWLARRAVGSSTMDPGVTIGALRSAGVSAALALLFMGTVASIGEARRHEGRWALPGWSRSRRAPWELVVLALAGASLFEVLSRGTAPVDTTTGAVKIDTLLLLFPVLFVAGGAGLAVRLAGRLLPKLRRWGRRRGPVLYLASRRLAGASRLATGMVTAVALSAGILIYAGILGLSVRTTAHAKAAVFTGADASFTVPEPVPPPAAIAARATTVSLIEQATFIPGGGQSEVLIVDRRTFSRGAFWDPSFSGKSLGALMAELSPAAPGAPIPVIAAGVPLPTRGTLVVARTTTPVSVSVVDQVRAFPGMPQRMPLLVADRRSAGALAKAGSINMVWVDGDAASARGALNGAGIPILAEATVADVSQTASLSALALTFGYLRALGDLIGMVAVAATLLYLSARQRARQVSYTLARRMGLGAWTHRWSVAVEVTGMLAVGLAIGAVLAWAGARLVYGKVDPLPLLPPSVLFRFPGSLVAAVAGALALVAAGGAIAVQAIADRADPAAVMRLASAG